MKKILVLTSIILMILLGVTAQAETIALGSDADTYIRGGNGPYGSDVLMGIYGGSYDFSGYLRFDLSSLGGIEITDASLTLTVTGGYLRNDTLVTGRFGLYALNNVAGNTPQGWDESTLVWETAGAEWTGVVPMDLTGARVVDMDMETNPNITETIVAGPGGAWDVGTTMTVSGSDLVAFLQGRVNDGGLANFIATNPDGALRAYGLASKENAVEAHRPILEITYSPIKHAFLPDPADDAMVPLDLTKLSWSNPDPNNPTDIITSDVYFGINDPNLYPLDPDHGLTLIADDITATEVNIPAAMLPLSASTTYYWVVDCTDPNEGLLPGEFWSFYVSGAPEIVADPAAAAKFETETADFSAIFTTDAVITTGWPKWYRVGDPDTEMLDSDTDVAITLDYDSGTGEYTSSLSIANLEAADEASYYCEISNTNGTTQTASTKLVVKRMLAYWPFDSDPNDLLDNYDGVATGDPVYAPGKVGNGIVFDGADDYITLPSGFDDFSAGMTISVWANPTSAANWARFIDLGNGEGPDVILFARFGTSNTLRFDFAPWPGAVDAADALALNVWQMFVLTMDESGNIVIYKDGFPVQTGTVTSLPPVITRTSNFIAKSNWADALYAGMMDDMRIYNYGLTADGVADLYSDVVGDYCREVPVYDMVNDDCKVNIDDFAYLADLWLDCGFYPDASCE